MRKRIAALTAALCLTLAACGGGGISPTPAPTPTPLPTAAPTPEPTPTPYDGPENPLTGLPIDGKWVNARPVAVMLNNLVAAQPQLGQSRADIIYEALAEGGITRMLGVYQSVEGVGKIGSVRSARTYYLELALGHDAVYLHAGGSPDAYNKIKAWNVTALDCVNGPYEGTGPGSNLFWRDADRIKNNGKVHSVITTGDTILERFPTYSFRQEHEEGYRYPQRFVEDAAPADGESAQVITVPFSNYKTGVFTYDVGTGKYLVSQYRKPYVDGNDGSQVAVTNVLILKTDCHVIPGDADGRMAVDLASGGEGWYACGGKWIPITWSKADRSSPFVYTDAAGEPLALQRGNSYVSIVPLSCGVTAQ